MALTSTVRAMITSHLHPDAVEAARPDMNVRAAVPAIAAVACIAAAAALWHLVIAAALGALP
jgi:hypothetical protein